MEHPVHPQNFAVGVALVAACMARGLTAEDAGRVSELLDREPPSTKATIEGIYSQIEDAVNQVRSERNHGSPDA